MKPSIIWCVWYRGKGLTVWSLLDCAMTRQIARDIRSMAYDRLLELRITKQEVKP